MSKAGTEQQLMIEGAGCASCVGKIEAALQNTPGVNSAEMNFCRPNRTRQWDSQSQDLVKAIESAGYNAKPFNDSSHTDSLDEKEAADWAYYKKLMRDTIIALSLGVPLMIYGIAIGEMTVATNIRAARVVNCWSFNACGYVFLW